MLADKIDGIVKRSIFRHEGTKSRRKDYWKHSGFSL